MNGHVDGEGRALVSISVLPTETFAAEEVPAWIDTGFNGELVLPQRTINDLGLAQSGTAKAILADGSRVMLKAYTCMIEWFEEEHELEIIANDGEYPLLGVGLLLGRDLSISYRSGDVTIE